MARTGGPAVSAGNGSREEASGEPADVIVVGSGAAGGWAAKEMSEAGLSVLLLEAGPAYTAAAAAREGLELMFTRLSRVARGRQRVQAFHPIYWAKNPDLFVDDVDEPYLTPQGMPFNWIRSRQLGGRTLLWGGLTLRLSDYELKSRTRGDYARDWPISYDELAPWYDRVERFIGIYGDADGMPQLPDGRYLGSRPLTAAEEVFRQKSAQHWPDRRVILSRGIDTAERLPGEKEWSKVTSCGTTLAAALRTGRTRIRTGSVVSHLVPDKGGKGVQAVAYVDTATGAVREARGRCVFLCASTVDTLRIMLHTAALYPTCPMADLPDLGRHLMDHVVTATVVELDDVPYEAPLPLTGAGSFLVPRFQNLKAGQESYAGGFGLWGEIQRGAFHGRRGSTRPRGFIVGHGDQEPRPDNRVELSPEKDRWGIPLPRITCSFNENDTRLHAAMKKSIEEMLSAAGGRGLKVLKALDHPGPWRAAARLESAWEAPPPGSYVHEVGGAPMGEKAQTSVLNSFNQCWGLPNLFVTDGSAFVTVGWQGPALTIMAMTARAADHAVTELRRGNL
jgi:choline dehydrogenase-like flavoprotein